MMRRRSDGREYRGGVVRGPARTRGAPPGTHNAGGASMRHLLRARLLASTISLFTLAAAITGCGCDDVLCNACPPPGIYVRVVEAGTEIPITDATVTADGKGCPLEGAVYLCDVPVGAHDITVAAPGYANNVAQATLDEPEESGCCGCAAQVNAQVDLTKVP